MRRTVRASISRQSAEIAKSFAGNTKPFIVDVNFCQFPPTFSIQHSQENHPGSLCVAKHPPPPGWGEAWTRAKDGAGLLVVRNSIPVGRGIAGFVQVMPAHPFHDVSSVIKETAANMEEDQDDIIIAGSGDHPSDAYATHECCE